MWQLDAIAGRVRRGCYCGRGLGEGVVARWLGEGLGEDVFEVDC